MIYPRPILKPKETYSKILQLLHALSKYADKDIMDKYFDDLNNSKEYMMFSSNHIFCDNYNFCLNLVDWYDNTIAFQLSVSENPKNHILGTGLSHFIKCDPYGEVIECRKSNTKYLGHGWGESIDEDLLYRNRKKRKVA